MAQVGDLLIAVKADVDTFHKSMATAREGLTNFGGVATSVGRTMRRTGLMITAGAGVASAAMAAMANSAKNVQTEYNQVQTLIDNNRNAMDEYQGAVRKLTSEFAVQGGEVETTQALYQTLSASIDGSKKETTEFLKVAMRTARVGGAEMETSVDLLSTTVNAYGEDAEWASEASDTLFAAVQEGKIRFEELAQTMGPVIAFSAQLGVSLEEMSAGMALLTKQGFSARRAAFALRSILQRFMRPGEQLKEILRDIAIEEELLGEEATKLSNQITEQEQELVGLKNEISEVGDELRDLQDDYGSLSSNIRENRIEIEEIRLQAQKSGRELTRSEKRRIEELKTANDELRLEQMKVRQEMDKKEKTQQELERQSDSVKDSIESNKEEMSKYTAGVGETVIENMGMADSLLAVSEKAEEMDTTVGEAIPNQRALQGIFPIIAEDGQRFADVMTEIEDSSSLVSNEWGEMSQTEAIKLARAVEDLKATFRAFGQSLLEEFRPVLERVGDALSNVRSFFEEMDSETRRAVARFAMLATAIGLIIGPLLILGGQLSIILGQTGLLGLIKLLAGSALAAGGLSEAFRRVTGDTEEATQVVENAQAAFNKIKDIALTLKDAFFKDLVPAFLEVGKGLVQWIKAVRSGMSELDSALGLGETSIRDITGAVGEIINKMGLWMQENKGAIESVTSFASEIVTNLLPPIIKLGREVGEVLISVMGSLITMFQGEGGQSSINSFGNAILRLTEIIGGAIGFIANLIDGNEKLVGAIVTAIVTFKVAMGVIGAVTATVAGLVAAFSSIGVTIGTVITIISTLVIALNPVTLAIAAVIAVVAGLAILFPEKFSIILGWITKFAKRAKVGFGVFIDLVTWIISKVIEMVSVIAENFKILIGILKGDIGVVEGLLKMMGNTFGFLSDTFDEVVGLIIDGLAKLIKGLKRGFFKFIEIYKRFIKKILDIFLDIHPFGDIIEKALNWGYEIVSSLTDGVLNALPDFENAVDKVAQKAKDYLGISSDANTGPLSTLTNWGGNLIKTIVNGMKRNIESISKVLNKIPGMGDNPLQFEANVEGGSGGNQPTTRIFKIEEGAVKFMPGAFQGVSDEEIPEMVREEIEDAFKEMKRELDGTGRSEP